MYNVTGRRERKQMARACIITSYAGNEAERLHDENASEELSRWDFDNAFETVSGVCDFASPLFVHRR